MIELLPEQVEALRQLKRACQEAGVDAVVVGATAYRVWIDDDRRTQDVDVAITVDIDQIESLTPPPNCGMDAGPKPRGALADPGRRTHRSAADRGAGLPDGLRDMAES